MNCLWKFWFSAIGRRRRFLFLFRFLFSMILPTLFRFLMLAVFGYGYLTILRINIPHPFWILYERKIWIRLGSLGLGDFWIKGFTANDARMEFALLLIVKWLLINFQRFISYSKFGVWETRIRLHFEEVLLIYSSLHSYPLDNLSIILI